MGRDCRKIFLSMTALLLFPLTALCAATPPEIVSALQQDFVPYRTLANYTIYRRK